jgi:hypothetical protein
MMSKTDEGIENEEDTSSSKSDMILASYSAAHKQYLPNGEL